MTNGTLKTVVGDVTNPQRLTPNEVVIIPHCCNNKGVIGAGVALALKKKWPEVEKEYMSGSLELGSVSCAVLDDGVVGPNQENPKVTTVIYNMIGQDGTVSTINSKPVKYWALVKAMKIIEGRCENIRNWNWFPGWSPNPVIHCPKFGSDLAGGNFDFILELIREIWIENGIDVVVYEFVPKINGEKMSKQICKVLIRNLHGDPQVIGWINESEVAPMLRLNQQYKIKGKPMFMVQAIPYLDITDAVQIVLSSDEFDK